MVEMLKRKAKAEANTEAKAEAKVEAKVEAKPSESKAPASADSPVKKMEPDGAIPTFFWVVLACLAISVVGSIVQESEVLEGGSLLRWYEGLFEEHVVPPPIAHDHVVTVQFCQS